MQTHYEHNGVDYWLGDTGAVFLGDGITRVYVPVSPGSTAREPLILDRADFEEARTMGIAPDTYWVRRGTHPVYQDKRGVWRAGGRGKRLHVATRAISRAYAQNTARNWNKHGGEYAE